MLYSALNTAQPRQDKVIRETRRNHLPRCLVLAARTDSDIASALIEPVQLRVLKAACCVDGCHAASEEGNTANRTGFFSTYRLA